MAVGENNRNLIGIVTQYVNQNEACIISIPFQITRIALWTTLELVQKKMAALPKHCHWITLSQNGYGTCVVCCDRVIIFVEIPTLFTVCRGENELNCKDSKKANSTLRASRAVPHPSTDRAFRHLTSEFRWDRVCSTKYGRWRMSSTGLKRLFRIFKFLKFTN